MNEALPHLIADCCPLRLPIRLIWQQCVGYRSLKSKKNRSNLGTLCNAAGNPGANGEVGVATVLSDGPTRGGTIPSIRDRLLKERNALLDLSTRNRLLNTPLRTKNNRVIEIVDENSAEVFRLLCSGKALTFLPGAQLSEEERAALGDDDDDVTGGIPQPDDENADARGIPGRHSDLRLQTRLTSAGLQKRLLDVWYDAETLEQEQGVNILYVAFGLLRWYDNDASDIARHAPLVLLPVKLERGSALEKFKLKWREEPPSPNLTLQAKLKAEFGIELEDFGDEDELDIAAYAASISTSVAHLNRWQVLPNSIVLGFFSFAKFLMYRDLDPDNWPAESGIDKQELVSALLRDGFPESEPLIPDSALLDEAITPLELHHVVDADSSQTVAISEASNGRSLVVKGPPGTGKSQTITNIIAAAVARGKKVLFVAEKMAALEVVHRRLRQAGLGSLTLELHSNKVSKRVVLEELKSTRDARLKDFRSDLSVVDRLHASITTLNDFARKLHTPLTPCGLTPHSILARLAKAQSNGTAEIVALNGVETWTASHVELRRAKLREVAERQKQIGPVGKHPWRGVRRGAIDPVERNQVRDSILEILQQLKSVQRAAQVANDFLGAPAISRFGDIQDALMYLRVLPLPAGADISTLADEGWSNLDTLRNLVSSGETYSIYLTEANSRFNEVGLKADYTDIRDVIVTRGKSLFRIFDSNYRAQLNRFQSYLKIPLPKTQGGRLALIDAILATQKLGSTFAPLESNGAVFGTAWKGLQSDWESLKQTLSWRSKQTHIGEKGWKALSKAEIRLSVKVAMEEMQNSAPKFFESVRKLFENLQLDHTRAFKANTLEEVPIAELATRLLAWVDDLEGLSRFIAFAKLTESLRSIGLESIENFIHEDKLDHHTIVDAFDFAYSEELRRALFEYWPELRSFDGHSHNNLVEQFRQLDKARISLAQEQIVSAHAASRPKGASGIGPLGVLNAELAKKRSHLPIRVLLDRAGPAIQQLKPVFMMSPLSVAQFLKPGGMSFDILVMDEASQIEPVDALGAIARVNQIVVVGDERQLPPTSFFKKLTGEEDPEEVDEGIALQAKDAESILDLCLAKGVPHRMLNWHYRSKHQSLIAVSNREFYDNKLFIVPSPYDAVAGMGLKFNLLKNAPYERGESRTNPEEARIVAEAVIKHARSSPNQSLGVATFSIAQRQAVLKELELLRRKNLDLEPFFVASGNEPFFVKNLENIQGDERDVIFISVGYGKTKEGYLAHAFGPLSAEGGERRLNVLISRAKLRCEVFCNFTGADIDLERTRSRGVVGFKMFLTFAETGNFGLGEVTGDDFDSEFEIQVCERLQAQGHAVRRQIGASGFRVDLAICDPDKPGRFLLGIECDGAQYHSSRSARDRDRLRQQVLEAHGWIIHRIWGADWYLRPQEELKKIEDAIAAAKSIWAIRDEEGTRQAPLESTISVSVQHSDDSSIETTIEQTTHERTDNANFYTEAHFSVDRSQEPHEVSATMMATYVLKVVETEGPIHLDEITARIRSLWGLGRAGARIRAAVEAGAKVAERKGAIEGGPFYQIPGQEINVRDRSKVSSSTLRRPDMLPPVELDIAILKVIDENFGAEKDDLVVAVSRLLGFSATSAQLRNTLGERIDSLTSTGALTLKGGLFERSPPTS